MRRAVIALLFVTALVLAWRGGVWLEDQGIMVRCVSCTRR